MDKENSNKTRDVLAESCREEAEQVMKYVQNKLNCGEGLSAAELENVSALDEELYAQAKELMEQRNTYCRQLLHSERPEILHEQTTETLGRQVARAKKTEELKMLRWQLMAAQDCYRALLKDRHNKKDAASAKKKETAAAVKEMPKHAVVPTPQQLAALMHASASNVLYSVKQMDRLMKNFLEEEEKDR